MNKIKKLGSKMAQKSVNALSYVRKHPMETIELLSAIFLLLFAIYIIIPLEWLPTVSTAYQYSWLRSVFGVLMALPAIRLLYIRLTSSSDDFIYYRQEKRRKALFWISMTWLYMAALRLLSVAFLPPLFLTFLLISFITLVCYIRLGG
jgi:hypothetical protein